MLAPEQMTTRASGPCSLDGAAPLQVEQTLTMRACDHCGAQTYDGSLSCHACKHQWEACMASGYPILSGERVVNGSGAGAVVAKRDDWNAWVNKFGTCPVTGEPAVQMYWGQ
jgi:hypothetical protein